MRSEYYRWSPSPLSTRSGAVVTKVKLTIGHRWHPRLDRIREAFDQSTQAEDPRMQQPQLLRISSILTRWQSRLPNQANETVLVPHKDQTLDVKSLPKRVTHLEWDYALPLRASDNPRKRLGRHLPHLHILIPKAVQQHFHDLCTSRVRNAQQVPVEENHKGRQRIQPDPPRLFRVSGRQEY